MTGAVTRIASWTRLWMRWRPMAKFQPRLRRRGMLPAALQYQKHPCTLGQKGTDVQLQQPDRPTLRITPVTDGITTLREAIRDARNTEQALRQRELYDEWLMQEGLKREDEHRAMRPKTAMRIR